MKTIRFYAFITALVLVAASCVENSEKYKNAVAQRDSLAMEKQALDSNYNQTLELLNDIEAGFAQINESEKQMKVDMKGIEGSKASKRQLIAAQMTAIKESMDENRAKIQELQQMASKSGKANNRLAETIKRLQAQMEEKNTEIQALQAELEQRNIRITELTTTVSERERNIEEQQSMLEQQRSTIKGQDTDINTVWYRVANTKQLKEEKIISGGGIFQGKKVLDTDFDRSVFNKVDLRSVSAIPTNSRKVKILTTHPKTSYNLVPGEDKNITIEITNPAQFWSVSKFLVVEI